MFVTTCTPATAAKVQPSTAATPPAPLVLSAAAPDESALALAVAAPTLTVEATPADMAWPVNVDVDDRCVFDVDFAAGAVSRLAEGIAEDATATTVEADSATAMREERLLSRSA